MLDTASTWLTDATKRWGKTDIYIPLYASRKEIRLLHLFAPSANSKHDQQLRCTLDNVSLLDSRRPLYEAISYCWGAICGNNEVIIINGSQVRVPASAAQALRRFRPGSGSVCLWIDAICINQENADERSQQVRLMRDIYRSANRTLIWLGTGYDPSTAGKIAAGLKDAVTEMKTESFDWLLRRRKSTPTAEHSQVLRRLFALPWFQRLWVVQEAVLAPSAMCHLGEHEFDWQDLCDCAHWVDSFNRDETVAKNTQKAGFNTAVIVRQYSRDQKVPLGQLLVMSRQLLVSDAKDKVYAVLGLASLQESPNVGVWQNDVLVDYNRALPAIYAAATRAALSEVPDDLSLLLEVEHVDSDRLALADQDYEDLFPSWVPRYDRRPTPAINAHHFPPVYWSNIKHVKAPSHIPPLVRRSTDSVKRLPLRGTVRDHISCVSPIIRLADSLRGRGTTPLLMRMIDLVFKTCGTCSIPALCDIMTTITDLATMYVPEDRAQSTDEGRHIASHLNVVAQHLASRHSMPAALAQINGLPFADTFIVLLRRVNALCINRRFFVTSSGLVGLGPQTMTGHQTERVVVLIGSRLPFILRSLGDIASASDSGYKPLMFSQYQMVGHCFVRGLDRATLTSGRITEQDEVKVLEIT
jgi:hypothetical protein